MSTDITVPSFPESITEGTVLTWHKQPGEKVSRGEVLAEVETDKIVFEVPAPTDGVLTEITAPVGTTVKTGEVLARLDKTIHGSTVPPQVAAAPAPAPVVAMPAAKRLLEQHGLDVRQVPGSGRGGRVLKEDVLKQLDMNEPVAPPAKPKPVPAPPAVSAGARSERRVPMTRLRKRIAERLVEAQHAAAILTTFNEVNMQPVMELRARHRERFEKEHGVRLGLMSFFVKAGVEALRHFPEINASIDGNDIVYHGFYDLGIAVSTPRGLVVPVLRDADRLTMAEIEWRIRDFGERAQNAQLMLEDITGGTFTITNGGVFGSLMSTPILNPPQSAILGMHKIQERPVVENAQIVIRPMMYLAVSYDHRLVDGREAVQFLVMIKELLEEPARLLLEV
ncbi:MAG: 2-oxoglutarate dehydrogenase complex dihydrolipoyllysine-residue succinyltransferase [Sulfuricaulis sp.]